MGQMRILVKILGSAGAGGVLPVWGWLFTAEGAEVSQRTLRYARWFEARLRSWRLSLGKLCSFFTAEGAKVRRGLQSNSKEKR
jgi:hypothetical protein